MGTPVSKQNNNEKSSITYWQRFAVGLIALGFLVIGGMMFASNAENAVLTAILVRVGALLGVIWLAMPQLESVQAKIPAFVMGTLLILLLVVAVRPNMFRIIAAIVAVGMALNWVLKWINLLTSNQKK